MLLVRHSSRKNRWGWYPDDTPHYTGFQSACYFVVNAKLDTLLILETPFDWKIVDFCKQVGVKTYVMPMYECMPRNFPQPDRFICPSLLDLQHFPGDRSVHIPVPVEVEWQQRTQANHFVHNAGNLGLRGRNGTLELLQAMEWVKSPIQLTVRAQPLTFKKLLNRVPNVRTDDRITVQLGTIPHEELWNVGDVFIWPEKFNGLSLPLQEARAAGMLVISTDRFPMNEWLPTEPLIPVSRTQRVCISKRCRTFVESTVSPRAIAQKIDEWYGKDITQYSLDGKFWAETMSWDVLSPLYLEELGRFCERGPTKTPSVFDAINNSD